MNVATIVRKVQRLFGDSTDEIVISQADIFDWIDEAQMQIIRKTHCNTKATTGLVASTFPLALPVDWILTKRLIYGTTVLTFVQIEDLDSMTRDTTVPSDSPNSYYIFAKQLRLYPAKAADTTTLEHDYVASATAVTSTAIPLDVPLSYHEDVVRYCVMRAHERNENREAQKMSSDIFESMTGERMQEASLGTDGNFIVRDTYDDYLDAYGVVW